jgi:hypothetical protein
MLLVDKVFFHKPGYSAQRKQRRGRKPKGLLQDSERSSAGLYPEMQLVVFRAILASQEFSAKSSVFWVLKRRCEPKQRGGSLEKVPITALISQGQGMWLRLLQKLV